MRGMGDERGREFAVAECGCRRLEVQEEGAVSIVISVLFGKFSHLPLLAVGYLYEMITCSIPICGWINSLRENPALANIFSYSAKVYASPLAVVASMVRANMAACGGSVRPSFGMKSAVTARPSSLSAA